MSPVASVVLSVILYALANHFIDSHLKDKVSPILLLTIMTSVVLFTALAGVVAEKVKGTEIQMPDAKIIWIALGTGVVIFLADMFFLNAYEKGSNSFQITSIFIMLPIATGALSYIFNRRVPEVREIAAFVLAAIAVLLLRK